MYGLCGYRSAAFPRVPYNGAYVRSVPRLSGNSGRPTVNVSSSSRSS
jgi:hypothetical protein